MKCLGKEYSMDTKAVCDFCGEEFEGTPVTRGSKIYCCEACAFEAGRSADCSGRTDSSVSSPIVEKLED
jgi:hypothetical protein